MPLVIRRDFPTRVVGEARNHGHLMPALEQASTEIVGERCNPDSIGVVRDRDDLNSHLGGQRREGVASVIVIGGHGFARKRLDWRGGKSVPHFAQ